MISACSLSVGKGVTRRFTSARFILLWATPFVFLPMPCNRLEIEEVKRQIAMRYFSHRDHRDFSADIEGWAANFALIAAGFPTVP